MFLNNKPELRNKSDSLCVFIGRQRRASESDTLMDVRPLAVGARGNVDILQMLSKAQDEYDKVLFVSFNIYGGFLKIVQRTAQCCCVNYLK